MNCATSNLQIFCYFDYLTSTLLVFWTLNAIALFLLFHPLCVAHSAFKYEHVVDGQFFFFFFLKLVT